MSDRQLKRFLDRQEVLEMQSGLASYEERRGNNMVSFTKKRGGIVYIEPTQVTSVSQYLNNHTLITFSNGNGIVVKEELADVIKKLKGQ